MDDEVEIDSESVYYWHHCYVNNNILDLKYFSSKGVVRLKISNVPFVKLFYLIDTSVTGNIYLFYVCNILP